MDLHTNQYSKECWESIFLIDSQVIDLFSPKKKRAENKK